MIILDGSLAEFSSCLQRGYGAFVSALILFVAFACMAALILRFQAQGNGSTAEGSAGRIGLYSVAGLFILLIVGFSLVVGVARKRTVLFVETDQLVERGCVKLRPFEDRFPLEGIRMTYEFHPKGQLHILRLQPSPTSRTLRVALNSSAQLKNLATIAPDAIRDYVSHLRHLGEPVPDVLR